MEYIVLLIGFLASITSFLFWTGEPVMFDKVEKVNLSHDIVR